MDKKKSVFLDSSVLIAGLYSDTGGSSRILKLIKEEKIVGFISPSIIEETKRNIKKKLSLKFLKKFEKIIKIVGIQEDFQPEDIINYRRLVDIKDLHVLVFTKSSGANFLITLDKKHFKTSRLQKANLSFKILTPKEFLEKW